MTWQWKLLRYPYHGGFYTQAAKEERGSGMLVNESAYFSVHQAAADINDNKLRCMSDAKAEK
jgi:hypothetical protein